MSLTSTTPPADVQAPARLSGSFEESLRKVAAAGSMDPVTATHRGYMRVLLAEVDRLREFERRVTEEVEEFEDAANDDPMTPPAARHMIKLLRMAMAEPPEAGDRR